MSLPLEIAAKAEEIVNSLTQTDYQHKDNIDPATGVYDCDCNGYLGFVLKNTAPNHLAHIPKETNQPRPRAFEYFTFFASLTPDSAGDWKRVDLMKDADRGDIIAWRFPTLEAQLRHRACGDPGRRAETRRFRRFLLGPRLRFRARSAFRRHKEAGWEPVAERNHRRWFGGPQFQSRRGRTAARLSLRAAAHRPIFLPHDRHRPRRLIDGDIQTL